MPDPQLPPDLPSDGEAPELPADDVRNDVVDEPVTETDAEAETASGKEPE